MTAVGSGLRLDHDRDPGRGDRHRVDISWPLPRKRVAQPPALGRSGITARCTSSSEPAPARLRPGERDPVASTDTEHHGNDQEQRAGHGSTAGHDAHSEDGRRRARQSQAGGAQRPSELLAARVVHAPPSPSEQLEPITRRSSYRRRTGSRRRRSRARRHNAERRRGDASQACFAGVREPAILLGAGMVHRCNRLERGAATRRALARPELCHRSILSPSRDGPDPVDCRPQIRPVLGAPWCVFLQPAPKAPFRSLESRHLQGESEYRYRDSKPASQERSRPLLPANLLVPGSTGTAAEGLKTALDRGRLWRDCGAASSA
jgi:hypothetical protein